MKHSRTPIPKRRSKPRRGPVKDPDYLAFIRSQPCCVCVAWQKRVGLKEYLMRNGIPEDITTHVVELSKLQSTPTEAAHVGARGLGQKCSDREAIPLCEKHHRTGPIAQHKLGKLFWKYHGIDREKTIAALSEQYGAKAAE